MTLAPCPNCSGYREDPGVWFFGQPHIMAGKRSRKIFIIGCCAFSSQSRRTYDTEQEAADAWNNYRAKAAARDSRISAMLSRLDALDKRLHSCTLGVTSAAE